MIGKPAFGNCLFCHNYPASHPKEIQRLPPMKTATYSASGPTRPAPPSRRQGFGIPDPFFGEGVSSPFNLYLLISRTGNCSSFLVPVFLRLATRQNARRKAHNSWIGHLYAHCCHDRGRAESPSSKNQESPAWGRRLHHLHSLGTIFLSKPLRPYTNTVINI